MASESTHTNYYSIVMIAKRISDMLAIALVAPLAVCTVIAQNTRVMAEAESKRNLTRHVDPTYPPIAKAANVQGAVVLQLEIDPGGNVANVNTISGPPMLIGAAVMAAKQWHYTPFQIDNSAVAVTTRVTIPFVLGPVDPKDQEIAAAYFPLSRKCIELVSQRGNPDEQAAACKKASDQADLFSKDSRYIERRSAYTYLARALIRDKKLKDAVDAGEKAIAVVLQGHDDGSGSSAAYGVTGQAKAFSGDLVGATKDLAVAEDYQRKALQTPAGQSLSREYTDTLKSLLSFDSQVQTSLGNTAAAQAKLDEAGKL